MPGANARQGNREALRLLTKDPKTLIRILHPDKVSNVFTNEYRQKTIVTNIYNETLVTIALS